MKSQDHICSNNTSKAYSEQAQSRIWKPTLQLKGVVSFFFWCQSLQKIISLVIAKHTSLHGGAYILLGFSYFQVLCFQEKYALRGSLMFVYLFCGLFFLNLVGTYFSWRNEIQRLFCSTTALKKLSPSWQRGGQEGLLLKKRLCFQGTNPYVR